MSALSKRISLATILAFLFTAQLASATDKGTVVHVTDATGEGIADVLLWVTPEKPHASRPFITDKHGVAHLPDFACKVCLIAALDPKGLFVNKTSEFSGGTPSLTLTLQVKPIIDHVDVSKAETARIKVEDSQGRPLRNQTVVIRQRNAALQKHWAWWLTTDASGITQTRIDPGSYVLATVINEKPQEGILQIEGPGTQGNRNATTTQRTSKPIVVRLSDSPIPSASD